MSQAMEPTSSDRGGLGTSEPVVVELGKHATTAIRVGSPFASTASAHLVAYGTSEEAVRRESAAGGVIAAGMLLVFAIPCMFWFKLGCGLISAAGTLLGIYGLLSRHARIAFGLVAIHVAILSLVAFWL